MRPPKPTPQDWVTGDEPMTGAQASHLKTLSEQAGQPEAYDEALTKAQASERIETLKLARLGLGSTPLCSTFPR